MDSPSSSEARLRTQALVLFALAWRLTDWWRAAKKPTLLLPDFMQPPSEGVVVAGTVAVAGTEGGTSGAVELELEAATRVDRLLVRCPSLHARYLPSLLWQNAHLQLLPFMLGCYLQEHWLQPFRWVSEHATLSDGEVVALDWVGGVPAADASSETPVLMLHHGAGGRSTDLPGQTYVREALRRGWLVCALNRRGHKPGLPLTRERWNFFVSLLNIALVLDF